MVDRRMHAHSENAPVIARGGLGALAILFACAIAPACTPAEQALAQNRAQEATVQTCRSASLHARRILRQTQRELQKLEIETRRRAKKLQQRGHDTLEKLEKFRPPASTRPPTHSDTAILCEANTCTIERATVELYAKEPMMLLHEGAIAPLPGGSLRVLSLRSDGLGERLGLRAGDTLVDVDGIPLMMVLRDRQTQRKLSVKRQWILSIRRGDQEIQRSIELR
ncbi:MAG TPA: hypothetical protein ENJ18_06975 [Nannocystis exedens]|nr:hypothetical protein [Nannocystis exedens]